MNKPCCRWLSEIIKWRWSLWNFPILLSGCRIFATLGHCKKWRKYPIIINGTQMIFDNTSENEAGNNVSVQTKSFTNISQILHKSFSQKIRPTVLFFGRSEFSFVSVQNKYYTNIKQIYEVSNICVIFGLHGHKHKYCTNITQILHKYFTNISQIFNTFNVYSTVF